MTQSQIDILYKNNKTLLHKNIVSVFECLSFENVGTAVSISLKLVLIVV